MPDDRPSRQPGWITMVPSTGDLARDLATARAQLVAVRLAQALAQRLDAVVPRPISVAAQQDWVVVRDGPTEGARLGIEPVGVQPGEPWARAVDRLAEILDLDRRDGPYPSRKTPEQVRYYLTGRLRPVATGEAPKWLCPALVQVRAAIATCWRMRPPIGSTPLSRPTAASPR